MQPIRFGELRRRLGRPANVKLLQLIGEPATVPPGGKASYAEMVTPKGLRAVAAYADAVAPNARMVIPWGADGRLSKPGTIVANAHAARLLIRVWTFRPENRFLAADFRDGAGESARNEAGSEAEIRRYLATGIDGFFTDDPAIGRRAVDG